MKAVHIMPALLLQKPSKTSKSRDHVKALERRLDLWHEGKIRELLEEAETLQSRLPKPSEKRDIASISKRFKDLMQRGNVNGAMKLLTNNMGGGVLPLNDDTLRLLQLKHPTGKAADENTILQGPEKKINHIVYEYSLRNNRRIQCIASCSNNQGRFRTIWSRCGRLEKTANLKSVWRK